MKRFCLFVSVGFLCCLILGCRTFRNESVIRHNGYYNKWIAVDVDKRAAPSGLHLLRLLVASSAPVKITYKKYGMPDYIKIDSFDKFTRAPINFVYLGRNIFVAVNFNRRGAVETPLNQIHPSRLPDNCMVIHKENITPIATNRKTDEKPSDISNVKSSENAEIPIETSSPIKEDATKHTERTMALPITTEKKETTNNDYEATNTQVMATDNTRKVSSSVEGNNSDKIGADTPSQEDTDNAIKQNLSSKSLKADKRASSSSAPRESAQLQDKSGVQRTTVGVGEITAAESVGSTSSFEEMLTTALIKTRKFDVIERSRIKTILQEQVFASQSGVVEGGVKLGGIKGVSYLIYGRITQCGFDRSSFEGGGQFSFDKNKAAMSVDIRLVNAQNGQSVIAETVNRSVSIGGGFKVQGFGSSAGKTDQLGDVMRETADAVVDRIVAAVFPMKVLAVQEDGTVVVNYGSGTFSNNDVLDVFSRGESIIDPDTGENYGSEETKVASLQVTSVHEKFSKCTVISGVISDVAPGMLCRPVTTQRGIENIKTNTRESKKGRAKR